MSTKQDKGQASLALSETEARPLAPLRIDSMEGLIRYALEHPGNTEAVERLVGLAERLQDRKAAQEFANALAKFQNECPAIERDSIAKIATRGGGSYSYRYAELDKIISTIKPYLHENGLSYTWDSEIREALLVCTCTLRHLNGHKETASFSCPVTSASAMSDQQKHASALSFARRQTLVQVLGLTSTDPDTDGGDSDPGEKISDQQVADLCALIEEVGASGEKLLKLMGVEKLEDIREGQYAEAVRALNARRSAR